MNVYATEDEQIEAVKDWLRTYGRSLVFGLVLALAVIFGWRYWQQKQTNLAYQASGIYEEVITSYAEDKKDFVEQQAQYLVTNYPKTAYATLGQLVAAKQFVEQKKYKEALINLKWVVDNSRFQNFQNLARVRSARLLLQLKQTQAALALLKPVDEDGFITYANIVRGDIYQSMGKKKQAKAAFTKALDGMNASEPLRQLIKMKVDNLV